MFGEFQRVPNVWDEKSKMYHVIRLLISLTLLCMIPQADQAQKPYFCTEKEFNELINLNVKVRRFVIFRDVVYVVLAEKVIFFRLPRIHKIVARSGHHFSYLSSPPSVVENRFESKGIGKLVGLRLNWTEYNAPQVIEIYSSVDERGQMTDWRVIKFDGPVPAIETGNSHHFPSKENYSDYLVRFENRLNIFEFRYDDFSLKMNMINKPDKSSVQRRFDFDYEVQMAIFYTDNQGLDNALLELDNKRNVHIKEFDLPLVSKSSRSKPVEVSVPLADLLGCRRPITSFEQVKGIFFDERQQITYLFTDRFYLRFYENLVKSSFFIDYQNLKSYDDIGLDYEFDSEEREWVVFENTPYVKWVKAERSNAYLTAFNKVYRIIPDSSNKIRLKPIGKPELSACLRQTLIVKSVVFCFHSTSYYQITKNQVVHSFKIKDLFASAPFRHFDQNQKLEFIFNYKDQEDRVVFMTNKNYLLLYYEFFDLDENNNLLFNFQSGKKLVSIKKNCLFSERGGECQKSVVVGGEQRWNPAFYGLALLPVVALLCVVGIYCYSKERTTDLQPRRKAFELKPTLVKPYPRKKALAPPNRPPPGALDSSVSETDMHSVSRKSLKSDGIYERDVDKSKRPAGRLRQGRRKDGR